LGLHSENAFSSFVHVEFEFMVSASAATDRLPTDVPKEWMGVDAEETDVRRPCALAGFAMLRQGFIEHGPLLRG
jgi:hypothetical protein